MNQCLKMALKNAIKENKDQRKKNMILMEIKTILEVGKKGLNKVFRRVYGNDELIWKETKGKE